MDIDTHIHLLRHFSEVDKKYISYLKRKGFKDIELIEKQLKILGGKFFSSFCKNPKELWEIIQKEIAIGNYKYIYYDNLNKYELIFSYTSSDFPNGIGTDSLIDITDLSESEKRKIVVTERGNGNIIKALKKNPKITYQINVIIKFINGKYVLKTIFPGMLAPPFPDIKNQTIEEYGLNKKFWDEHVVCL